MNVLRKDPLDDLVGGFLKMDLVEAATEPRRRKNSRNRYKPQLGIRLETARQLQLRGFGTVGALFWRGTGWFASTSKTWLSDELRAEIVEEMTAFDDFIRWFGITATKLLFQQAVELPGEYCPSIINPAGETRFNSREHPDCDALPWESTPGYEQQFAEQSLEGHVEGL